MPVPSVGSSKANQSLFIPRVLTNPVRFDWLEPCQCGVRAALTFERGEVAFHAGRLAVFKVRSKGRDGIPALLPPPKACPEPPLRGPVLAPFRQKLVSRL